MCTPTAMVALTVASMTMTANSQIQQGRFKKGVSKYNARVAENEAQNTRNVATESENIQRRKTAELLSKQKAQLGAGNIDLTSGSALQLQEDTVALGEADALRIRSNADAKVSSLNTGAELTRRQGDYAVIAGRNNAVGTVLSGSASIAGTGVSDKWFAPNSAGVNGGVNIGFKPTELKL